MASSGPATRDNKPASNTIMKVSYDQEVDAAYIILMSEIDAGDAVMTYACNPTVTGRSASTGTHWYRKRAPRLQCVRPCVL